eukprot:g4046.t1
MLASWLSRESSSTSPIVSGSPRIDALASSGQKDLSGKRKGSKRKVVDVGGISPEAAGALENSWSQGKRRVKKKRKKVTAKGSKAKAKAVAPTKRSSATDMIPGTTLNVYPAGILASLPHDPYSSISDSSRSNWIRGVARRSDAEDATFKLALTQRIASGTVCSVHLAKHGDSVYVVKAHDDDPNHWAESRFWNELETLMALRGVPGIVQLIGISISKFGDKTYRCLILEHLKGPTLSKWRSSVTVDEDAARECIRSIAKALSHCHDKGRIHCDIKSDNVCEREKVGGFDLKLIDFGQSISLEKYSSMETFDDGESYFEGGAFVYMSPQVARLAFHKLQRSAGEVKGILKNAKFTQRADCWSLGILTYRIIVGSFPFNLSDYGGSSLNQVRDIVTAHKKDSSLWDAHPSFSSLSEDGQDFIRKLLAYEEEDRLDIHKALAHPWIAQSNESSGCIVCFLPLCFGVLSALQSDGVVQMPHFIPGIPLLIFTNIIMLVSLCFAFYDFDEQLFNEEDGIGRLTFYMMMFCMNIIIAMINVWVHISVLTTMPIGEKFILLFVALITILVGSCALSVALIAGKMSSSLDSAWAVVLTPSWIVDCALLSFDIWLLNSVFRERDALEEDNPAVSSMKFLTVEVSATYAAGFLSKILFCIAGTPKLIVIAPLIVVWGIGFTLWMFMNCIDCFRKIRASCNWMSEQRGRNAAAKKERSFRSLTELQATPFSLKHQKASKEADLKLCALQIINAVAHRKIPPQNVNGGTSSRHIPELSEDESVAIRRLECNLKRLSSTMRVALGIKILSTIETLLREHNELLATETNREDLVHVCGAFIDRASSGVISSDSDGLETVCRLYG